MITSKWDWPTTEDAALAASTASVSTESAFRTRSHLGAQLPESVRSCRPEAESCWPARTVDLAYRRRYCFRRVLSCVRSGDTGRLARLSGGSRAARTVVSAASRASASGTETAMSARWRCIHSVSACSSM